MFVIHRKIKSDRIKIKIVKIRAGGGNCPDKVLKGIGHIVQFCQFKIIFKVK